MTQFFTAEDIPLTGLTVIPDVDSDSDWSDSDDDSLGVSADVADFVSLLEEVVEDIKQLQPNQIFVLPGLISAETAAVMAQAFPPCTGMRISASVPIAVALAATVALAERACLVLDGDVSSAVAD